MGYILFSSDDKFSIQARQMWDGTIEYSYNNKEWKEWDGKEIINNVIYMRGINNTVITGSEFGAYSWIVNGKNVKCQGNIENLLDYKSVINNILPPLGMACFARMFEDCKALQEVSLILTSSLSWRCYGYMLLNCTNLQIAPYFSTLQMAKETIVNQQMLEGCPIQTININNKLYDINVLKLL